LSRWLELARIIGAARFFVDGSFVTAKPVPADVDCVILLPGDFEKLVEIGNEAALELEGMLLARQPEEIFAAEDDDDWREWAEFSAARVNRMDAARGSWRCNCDQHDARI
jgi:hypothetical protein